MTVLYFYFVMVYSHKMSRYALLIVSFFACLQYPLIRMFVSYWCFLESEIPEWRLREHVSSIRQYSQPRHNMCGDSETHRYWRSAHNSLACRIDAQDFVMSPMPCILFTVFIIAVNCATIHTHLVSPNSYLRSDIEFFYFEFSATYI